MIHRRNRPGLKRPDVPLSVGIGLWVIVLALIASGAWAGFGLTELFVWSDQADRVQYSLVLAGGIGAVAALVVSYRKQKLAEASAILDLESHFGGRFLAATEQLGSSAPTVRMAGALSLARLADDWVTQRQMVIDVITAYLRIPAVGIEAAEDEIRASLFRTIRDRLRPTASPGWQGLNFDFTGAELAGADFTGIDVRGGTVLNFTEATFSRGVIRLSGNFAGGTLAFTRAQFCGALVEISGAIGVDLLDFDGSTISSGLVRMDGVTFTGKRISFQGLSIRSAVLSFSGATFETDDVDFAGIVVGDGGRFFFDHCSVVRGDLSFINARLRGDAAYFAGTTFSGKKLFFSATRFAAAVVIFDDVDFGGQVVDFSGTRLLGPDVRFHKAAIHPDSLVVRDAAYVEGVVDWGRLDNLRDAFIVFADEHALVSYDDTQRESTIESAIEFFARQREEP